MADELTQQEDGGNTYREEVERALDEDTTRLGDVWRHREQDPQTIADELEILTWGFVYSYRAYIKAITDGTLPEAPTITRQCASTLRGFARRHQESFSPETRLELQERANECDRLTNDPAKQAAEEQELERQTRAAEERGVPGIYVYALPHYLRFPIEISNNDKTDDRTYLKVGRSGRDAIERFRQQRRSTELPEPPILLRIYIDPNGRDIAEIEGKIHQHLEAADHVRNAERGAGTEWFLTHLKFLDSTAELLGLEIHFRIEDSEDD